uniref:Antibiotic transport system ATP-binding protein n=1 Tax=Acetithermum autotrophicum TaxID=1446466 RepID=H5SSK9_ACEAU|nr:antibiotic transport system ATP-binding protein [Candidatus Acetothermum autotrophicum]
MRSGGLVVQGVSKVLKGKTILQGVDIHVNPGEVVLLKGPNGSGKSTLVHLISGVYRLEEGDIWVDGISLKKEPRRAKAAVTTTFQETLFDPLSSPLQALYMHTRFYGARWSYEQVRHTLEEFGVTEPTRPIFQLSGGTKKKVELLKARLVETPIYILDEPFAGLDESSRKQTEELVHTRKRQGKAVLLVSHEPGRLDFVDRTVHMEAGRIVPVVLEKEVPEMLVEAIVKGWKEEHRAELAGCAGLQLLEVQTMEPTDQEIEDLLKSLGLDKLGKSVQVIQVGGNVAQDILKQLGGAAQTVSVQQSSLLRTRLKLAGEISLAQVTQWLEEHGLEVLEVRQV